MTTSAELRERPVRFVRVQFAANRRDRVFDVASIDGSAALDEELAKIFKSWRDFKYSVRDLAAMRETFGVRGFGVCFTNKQEWHPPAPLLTPTEPLPLDETHPALEPLVKHLHGGDASGADGHTLVGGAAAADVGAATKAQPPTMLPWWRRWMVQTGVTLTLLLVLLPQLLMQLVLGRSAWLGIALLLGLGVIVLATAWLMRGREQWLVMPGGLLIRGSGWLGMGARLRRFTADDYVLSMNVQPAVGGGMAYGVSVYALDGKQVAVRLLTPLEAEVLLACWGSPLVLPSVEELTDLA